MGEKNGRCYPIIIVRRSKYAGSDLQSKGDFEYTQTSQLRPLFTHTDGMGIDLESFRIRQVLLDGKGD